MTRAYVTWDPDDGSLDKHAAPEKRLPACKLRVVLASSPKKAALLAAPAMSGYDPYKTVAVMLADHIGQYNSRTRKYSVVFKRVVSKAIEEK